MYSPISKAKVLIDRTDTIQSEINTVTGLKLINRIKWLSDCEYSILRLRSNKVEKSGLDSFFERIPINISIISTGKNYYVFTTTIDSADKHLKYSDTIWVDRE